MLSTQPTEGEFASTALAYESDIKGSLEIGLDLIRDLGLVFLVMLFAEPKIVAGVSGHPVETEIL